MARKTAKRSKAARFQAGKLSRDTHNIPLESIRHCLKLSPCCSEDLLSYLCKVFRSWADGPGDVVFVALDTETYGQNVREIGLSILDTRDLKCFYPSTESIDLSSVISSYNYITCQSSGKSSKRQFKFGASKRIDIRWVPWLLNKVFQTGSPDPSVTEKRHVIVVGHAIGSDFRSLAKISFLLDAESDVVVVDTSHLWREVFSNITTDWAPALIDVVEWLGISHEHVRLHCAGNDANLTLKVLLKLAMESCSVLEMNTENQEMREMLSTAIEANEVGWPTEIEDMDYEHFREAELEALAREYDPGYSS